MKTNKSFKYRIFPKEEQVALLKQCGGNTRFLWNYFWNTQQDYYEEHKQYLTAFDLNYFLPILKKAEGFQFLNNSFSQSLCQVSDDLKKAINRAFDKDIVASRNKAIAKAMAEPDEEKRQKKLAKAYKHGFPKFHKKNDLEDSFRISTKFKIKKSRIYIPLVGWIDYDQHRRYEGIPKNITISQSGKEWFAAVCCEVELQDKEIKTDNVVGIDVGLKVFATLSDKTVVKNPRFYRKKETKLHRLQRSLSRRQYNKETKKSSKRRETQRLKVHSVHQTIKNQRKDFLHQLTSRMIVKYDGFILEDISTKNLMKNHKLAKSIADVSWSEFGRILKYKSDWNFKYFEKIDRFAPSSQICNKCGNRQLMPLNERTYHCMKCENIVDRDYNASLNIYDFSSLAAEKRILLGREEIYGQGETSLEDSLNCQKELTNHR